MYIYYEADIGAAIVSFDVCLQEQTLVKVERKSLHGKPANPCSLPFVYITCEPR